MKRQRIVVGFWLLTKETCRALSTVLSSKAFDPSSQRDEVGSLLLTTLMSLKHAGAAFAVTVHYSSSHLICCFGSEDPAVRQFSAEWLFSRLVDEISKTDRIALRVVDADENASNTDAYKQQDLYSI